MREEGQSDGRDQLSPAERATLCYERRIERLRRRGVIGDIAPLMVAAYREQSQLLGLVQEAVASVAAEHGLSGMQRFWYQGFGREVYGRWRRFGQGRLEPELASVRTRWLLRGLDPALLALVEARVLAALESLVDTEPDPPTLKS